MTTPPIGPEVDTTPRPLPARIPHRGAAATLEPLAVRHAEDLWQAAQADPAGHSWAYMGYDGRISYEGMTAVASLCIQLSECILHGIYNAIAGMCHRGEGQCCRREKTCCAVSYVA